MIVASIRMPPPSAVANIFASVPGDALQAAKAAELSANGQGKESADFYLAKIHTAAFYFERILPRADAHRSGALAPTSAVMQIDKDHFVFR